MAAEEMRLRLSAGDEGMPIEDEGVVIANKVQERHSKEWETRITENCARWQPVIVVSGGLAWGM